MSFRSLNYQGQKLRQRSDDDSGNTLLLAVLESNTIYNVMENAEVGSRVHSAVVYWMHSYISAALSVTGADAGTDSGAGAGAGAH